MMPNSQNKTQVLNDRLRHTIPFCRPADRIVMTQGINSLEPDVIADIWEKVRAYNDFNEADDPFGEHDFGAFTCKGNHILWKIDYYNLDLDWGSSDPSDENKTARVLTVMLAEEY